MATLKARTRGQLPDRDFAYPERRLLPIHDAAHIRAAIGRFSRTQFASVAAMKRAAGIILDRAKDHGISVSEDSYVYRAWRGNLSGQRRAKPKARRNPAAAADRKALARARALSQQFHGSDAEVVELSAAERRPLPRYAVLVGSVEDLTYKTDDASPKRRGLPWRHKSGDRGPFRPMDREQPLLVADPFTGKPALVANKSRMHLTRRGLSG